MVSLYLSTIDTLERIVCRRTILSIHQFLCNTIIPTRILPQVCGVMRCTCVLVSLKSIFSPGSYTWQAQFEDERVQRE